jgi:hypothetical protein
MALVHQGVVTRRFEPQDPRLGRHVHLDARSLAYTVERDLGAMCTPIKARHWPRVIPIQDQGQTGSCTGHAGTSALGTAPLWDLTGHTLLSARDNGEDEVYALDLYEEATRNDPFPGSYPPTDTGSDGLTVAKVLRTRGTIGSYSHATSAQGLLVALQHGPVMLGLPWYNAFFTPDRDHFIDMKGWGRSGVAGGHEVLICGLDPNHRDAAGSVLTVANSWSTSWGDAGYFRMRLATWTLLRRDCDLIQLAA